MALLPMPVNKLDYTRGFEGEVAIEAFLFLQDLNSFTYSRLAGQAG